MKGECPAPAKNLAVAIQACKFGLVVCDVQLLLEQYVGALPQTAIMVYANKMLAQAVQNLEKYLRDDVVPFQELASERHALHAECRGIHKDNCDLAEVHDPEDADVRGVCKQNHVATFH